MPSAFSYRAMTAAGIRVRGRSDADSGSALQRTLEAQGLLVLEVTQCTEADRAPEKRASRRQVLAVTRALSSLLSAGLPLTRALAAAAGAAPGTAGDALGDIRSRIERGETLVAAMGRHPGCFSALYLSLVRAGEQSADLPASFARLTAHLERDMALRSRLISAAIYPVLLTVAGIGAVVVLVLFVLPRFVELLADAGAAVPRSTQLLVSAVGFVQHHPIQLSALPVGVAILVWWGRSTERGRRAAARLCLTLPLIGAMRRHVIGARFARLLAVLLGGGATLFRALGGVAESMTDPVARDDVNRIRTRIREGDSLHASLRDSRVLPVVLWQLLQVGEEAGEVREFASRAADLLEDETERTVQRLTAMLEPVMIIGFGVIVGFIALSLLQAIYGVNAGSFR